METENTHSYNKNRCNVTAYPWFANMYFVNIYCLYLVCISSQCNTCWALLLFINLLCFHFVLFFTINLVQYTKVGIDREPFSPLQFKFSIPFLKSLIQYRWLRGVLYDVESFSFLGLGKPSSQIDVQKGSQEKHCFVHREWKAVWWFKQTDKWTGRKRKV